ncbi:MAG: ammonia-forming cytochrome c nitrite reductase subunit c552, partial [Gemmataceae bacterium]
MPDGATPPEAKSRGWLIYPLSLLAAAGATFGLVALLMNISQRKDEARHTFVDLSGLDESTVDPEVWGRSFPRQYDSYRRTVDTQRTKHGGSEAFDKLAADPRLKRLWAGYPFAADFREERGHAYMLRDQDVTKRVTDFKQYGACLHCHSSIIPAYRQAGDGDVMKGFEKVCGMPLPEARKLVDHPVSCLDCHDPKSMRLRVTRPGFLNGIRELAKGDAPVPHLPSVERWRKEKGQKPYDPNADATRQEMRSFVCGQCHVEYYFKGPGKVVTYPWSRGLKADQIEAYYDEDAKGFSDWTHAETGAGVLKAQHPEFEMWSQGIHARSGVACADCHMPYVREGALKVSNHHVRSPLLNVAQACQVCHRYPEQEILARAEAIQGRTKAIQDRAEDAVIALLDAVGEAKKRGVADDKLAEARKLHRKAQWRVDFVNAENSMGFHAPQEAARVLAEAIDYAR